MNATILNRAGGYQVVHIEGAHLVGNPGSPWRKFTGVQSERGLKHQFTIMVDEEFVQVLKDYGLDVRWYEKEGYPGFWYLTVSLSWKFRDPKVFTVAYNGVKSAEDETTIGDLDQNDNIQFIDLDVSKSHWEYMGKSGYSAYGSEVYIYLGAPSMSEQRYMERFGNCVAQPMAASPASNVDDIPWDDDVPM